MQPMPQSICAIVCIYVCFGPTQRLLPGVSIYSLYTNCCSCSSPRRVVSPSALSSLSDSSPPAHIWFHYSKDDPIPPITISSSRFSPSTGCLHMPDVISLSDPRQRRRKYQDWWTSLRFKSVAFFIFIFPILLHFAAKSSSRTVFLHAVPLLRFLTACWGYS